MFVEMFQKRIADWEISEETEIIPLGKSFWVPDYRLVHRATGQCVKISLLGSVRCGPLHPSDDLRAVLTARGSELLCELESSIDLCGELRAKLETAAERVRRLRNLGARFGQQTAGYVAGFAQGLARPSAARPNV